MRELKANRTLVKSPPELWAECSDAAALARHLGAFGEIRITRLEPETAVAWEGERVSGTVRLEPSGWGTRVVLTARLASAPAPIQRARATAPPPALLEPRPTGLLARLRARWRRPLVIDEPPSATLEDSLPPEGPAPPEDPAPPDPEALLSAALDSLGQAHHRPFSRA